jgi:2'-5' RNA ligase
MTDEASRREHENGPPRDALRLFVAVLLPETWLLALEGMQAQLRRTGLRLRYTRSEGIHLTLKFLGEVPRERLDAITAALERLTDAPGPFQLALGAAGSFGGARRPRVVWTGMDGDLAALDRLHGAVERALRPAGFPSEGRPFRAHLTLARVPDGLPAAEAARIVPALAGLNAAAPPFTVESFALLRSELGPGGARYTALHSWPLSDRSA